MGTPVTARTGTSYKTEMSMGSHTMIADEPIAAGGTDLGPTPYDLLAASLAACKSMTLRFYAKREKMPLEGAIVTVTHDRQHAKDCEECLTKEGYIHRFEVQIELSGALSDVQRAKLLEIAGRCPVARTLEAEIQIRDTLV